MSGQEGLSKIDNKLADLERVLDEFEKGLGLSIEQNPDISYALNLKREQLSKLSPEECGELAYVLAQQSTSLQKEINKYSQRGSWANTNIDSMICSHIDNYGGRFTTYDNRIMLAIKDNEYTMKLYEVLVQSQIIIDRLSYLPAKISYMSRTLIELQQTKRRS